MAPHRPGETDKTVMGPVTADMAREIAATAVWRRLLFDPVSGALLDHGRTTYTPPVALADHVKARDVYCRFPGCGRKAVNGELDHLLAYADGGHTSDINLAGLCVRHHHLKHAGGGWQVRALPDGGLEWITPTGHTHVTRPYDYRGDPRSTLSVGSGRGHHRPGPDARRHPGPIWVSRSGRPNAATGPSNTVIRAMPDGLAVSTAMPSARCTPSASRR